MQPESTCGLTVTFTRSPDGKVETGTMGCSRLRLGTCPNGARLPFTGEALPPDPRRRALIEELGQAYQNTCKPQG